MRDSIPTLSLSLARPTRSRNPVEVRLRAVTDESSYSQLTQVLTGSGLPATVSPFQQGISKFVVGFIDSVRSRNTIQDDADDSNVQDHEDNIVRMRHAKSNGLLISKVGDDGEIKDDFADKIGIYGARRAVDAHS